jgi:aminotransferase EvaB
MIKSWDFRNEYNFLKSKIFSKLNKVFNSGNLFFSEEVRLFEENFLRENKSKYGVSVANGTDAIYLALKALNIGTNDEVITVANTAIPTVSAIRNAGASEVFVDIGSDYLIDVEKIEKSITKKTKAIIPVHLYGQSCDMEKISAIAKKYKLKIIEDCAQAQGAMFKNKLVGNFGIFGCFSFYPTKILGAYGDGGFITTSNYNLYKKLRRLRFYGIEQIDKKKWWNNKYYAEENGTNSRLNEMQAAILNIKIKYLQKYIKRRNEIARIYEKKISNPKITKPLVHKHNFHVYHLYVVSSAYRELILRKMKKNNIHLTIQYPYPINKMKAYKKINGKKLKNTENFSRTIFSLPTYPMIEKSKIYKIINILNSI